MNRKQELNLKSGSKSQKRGAAGERRAVLYLRLHGYRILERNYLYGHKEVDIIAAKRSVIAFIEVKARESTSIAPSMSVTSKKQSNIIAASNWYVAKHGIKNKIIRYDVIEVDLGRKLFFGSVNHITDAFRAR